MTPEQLIVIRTSLGLNKAQFAKLLGYAPSTISKWESGSRTLQPRTIKAIEALKGEQDE